VPAARGVVWVVPFSQGDGMAGGARLGQPAMWRDLPIAAAPPIRMTMFGALCRIGRCRVTGRHAHVGDSVYALDEGETSHSLVCWKAPVPAPPSDPEPRPLLSFELVEFEVDIEPVTGGS